MKKSTSSTSSSFDNARSALDTADVFFNSLIEPSTELVLDLESSESNGPPELLIEFNGQIIFQQHIPAGKHVHRIMLNAVEHNCLTLSMNNKGAQDTVVIDNNIVADKWIKINQLSINNYHLITDYDFFRKFFSYKVENESQIPLPGFWKNSKLTLEFDTPFELWYVDCAQSNVSVSNELSYRMVGTTSILELEDQLLDLLTRLKY